jgi:tetratricopeptide (TPR) repeat protein
MISAAEKIATINPNAASMLGAAGFWLCIAGEYERGIDLFNRGSELNPLHPSWLHLAPYFYHIDKNDLEKALHHANEFGLPDFFWGALIRAAVLGLLGRSADAKTAYANLLELKPDFTENAREYVRFFVLDKRLLEKILAGLRNAGF